MSKPKTEREIGLEAGIRYAVECLLCDTVTKETEPLANIIVDSLVYAFNKREEEADKQRDGN